MPANPPCLPPRTAIIGFSQPLRKLPVACWAFGIGGFLLPSLAWVFADHSVWDAESATFGRHSLALWSSVVGANDEPWAWLMLHFQTQKAPGISWLTQGFAALAFLTGDVTRALLLSTLVAHAATLAVIAATVRALYPHRVMPAWIALLFVVSGPQFVAVGHRYVSEPWQVLVVALFYLLAAKARDTSPVELLCALVILSAWGLLANAMTPIYVFLPGLWSVGVLFEAVRKKKPALPEARVRAGLLLGLAFCSAVGALACYALHGKAILGHAQGAEGSLIAQGVHGLRRLLHVSWLPACGLAFLLAWAVAKAWPLRGPRGFSMPAPTIRPVLLGIALLQIAGVLLAIHPQGPTMDPRLLGLVPATALWVAEMAHSVRRTRAPWVLAGILLLQWGFTHAQTWGLRTSRLLQVHTPMKTIDRHGIVLAEIQRLLDVTAYQGEEEARVVAVSVPWLNAHTLNFHSSARVYEQKPFCLYTALGEIRRDGQAALGFLAEREPRYVISLRKNVIERETDTLSRAGESIRQGLERSSQYRRVSFESSAGILLFEPVRTRKTPP